MSRKAVFLFPVESQPFLRKNMLMDKYQLLSANAEMN